jgi:hypothetical protein
MTRPIHSRRARSPALDGSETACLASAGDASCSSASCTCVSGATVTPAIDISASGDAALASGHRLSSTCGISQVARKASAAIGTATRNTVWIDSA